MARRVRIACHSLRGGRCENADSVTGDGSGDDNEVGAVVVGDGVRGSGGNADRWESAGVNISGNTTESDEANGVGVGAGSSDGSGGGEREFGEAETLDNSPAQMASAHCSQNSHHNECGLLEDNHYIPQAELAPPDFTWGELNGPKFCYQINEAFNEVVHWRHDIFQVPSGKQGTAFVTELARLYQAYADGSTIECIALKATTVCQCLLLQNYMQKVNQEVIQIAWNSDYHCGKVATSTHF